MSLIDRLISIIGTKGIYVFDRGYDRERGIINELLDRNLKFQIRAVGTRNIIDSKTGEKISLKKLADKTKTHKRIVNFPYKIDKKDSKIKGKIGFSKFKMPGSEKELTLCVLKKYSNEIAMMIITNLDIKDRNDVVKVFANYSLRWSIEDTYKYIKQEFGIEKIQLIPKILFEQAKNLKRNLKYKEHAIIAGIRAILSINSIGIREYFRKIIIKIHPPGQTYLFDKIANPYEILGKL